MAYTGLFDTRREVISHDANQLFFGFEGQPTAKNFRYGRLRNTGESFGLYDTAKEIISTNTGQLFFGFTGQPVAKAFGIGRFRNYGESFGLYDTRRNVADVTSVSFGTRRVVLESTVEPEATFDHTERMRGHLISQFQWEVIGGQIYADKPVLRAIISALGAELDELNAAITALKTKRWLDTAEGAQLDGLGEIVDHSRTIGKAIAIKVFGFNGQPNVGGFSAARFRGEDESSLETYILQDPEYRLVLMQKAAKNASNATMEDTIASLKFVFNVPTVVVEEPGNANITVAIGRQLEANEILLANAVDLIIRGGGVGLRYKAYYNRSRYFGFYGQPNAYGFEKGQFAQVF